ncbi:MAG: VWA domain-containing protein [Myxococcaceae bacterium]|nr:VWA domain-containing protein [Myxococcaceae bacterium]
MSNLAEQLTESEPSSGCRLVSTDGRTLPLLGTELLAEARGGVARVSLQQRFKNPFDEPLKVTYQLPLPADGAVSGFAFQLGADRVVGVVEPKGKARERFEEAILSGRTAAILEQTRSSLFSQEVGNIPARGEVTVEVQIDQKLAWLPEGAWEWRFPTVVAPRYLGGAGRVRDAQDVTVSIAEGGLEARNHLALTVRDALATGARPTSPSHATQASDTKDRVEVTFAGEQGVALDRDVVVRWAVAQAEPGLTLDVARRESGAASGSAHGLLTLTPPAPAARFAATPRDLVFLLDISGSMSGEPIDQARRVALAMLDTLSPSDQLEMIAFSTHAVRWTAGPMEASERSLQSARKWLDGLRASGGTEMRDGIVAALQPLRGDAQRQVVLFTDGQIGFESEVVSEIVDRLPAGSRVHVVGVGSGVNRSLTMPASRAGRGVELIIGLGEDAELAARRIVARTDALVLTEVQIEGTAVEGCAPAFTPDVFAGAPLLASLKLRPEGGTVVVRAKTAKGPWTRELSIAAIEPGEGPQHLPALYAREAVEDLELALHAGRSARELNPRIEALGVDFQISTRLTSWVAVSQAQTVDPRSASRTVRQPHVLAHGLSAQGIGLRKAVGPVAAGMTATTVASYSLAAPMPRSAPSPAAPPPAAGKPAAPPPPRRAREEAKRDAADLERSMRTLDRSDEESDDASAEAPSMMEAPEGAPKAPGSARGIAGAPPTKAKAPAKKSGPLDKLAQRVRSAFGGGKAERTRDDGRRTFRATIVKHRDGTLVVRFEVTGGPLTWAPRTVWLELGNGERREVPVEVKLTSVDCPAGEGLTLTLGVTAGELPAPVVRVLVDSAGEAIALVL